jgi:transcriptional regulator with XRE-family HTH domain
LNNYLVGFAMNLQEIGKIVRARREALGLSQQRLARLAGLSRTTINLLETGNLADLGIVKVGELLDLLGLVLDAHQPDRPSANPIQIASKTASVSYRENLTPDELILALTTGAIPHNRAAHFSTLVDEAPLSLLVSAVETAALKSAVSPKKIWKHISQWAADFQSPRKCWVGS